MEKKPFLTEAMAQEIIQDVPTPFHVYDEKGIRENARRIKIKNSNLLLLRLLFREDIHTLLRSTTMASMK